MASSTSQTLILINELKSLFSDESIEKKLRIAIKNISYIHRLFGKLLHVIDQYHKQGKHIDQWTDLSIHLTNCKQLINENLQNSERISTLEECLFTIREHYRSIRNNVQTLENINAKIDKKLQGKKHKTEIGQLIVRGIDEKIPNLISFDSQKSKSDILKKFYEHFLNYISFIRESSENIFDDDHVYVLKLNNLQTKLLNKDLINIKDYFLKLKDKLIDDNRGYSTEILLRNFVQNPFVHISVSNNSKFYSVQFIRIFEKLTQANDQKCIEPLTTLIFYLDRTYFTKFNLIMFENQQMIDFIFKTMYNKGIELYSISKEKFFDLFELILSKKVDLLNRLRDSIIDDKNSSQTFDLLSNIYGQHIRSLKLNPSDVKYCFNYLFFKSLTYKQIDDVPMPSLFAQLLFYIHTFDNRIHSSNDTENEFHEQDLINLKNIFLEVYNENNSVHLTDIIEILRTFINIQTYDFRLKTTIIILSKCKSNLDTNIKIEILKQFFDNTTNEKELCLKLAQSFNIHLLKHIFKDRNLLIQKLSEHNRNFKLVLDLNKELGNVFDIDRDLTVGFNTPYYLSMNLIEDRRYNERTHKIIMSILFKVFNCSSNYDKNELNKLFQSVIDLIEFYNRNDHKDICRQLEQLSIGYILDGFTGEDEENLHDRNEYARRIIENLINYKFEHVIKIVDLTKSNLEVINMFNRIMTRKDSYSLREWTENTTNKLDDKLYFLYCYHQYSRDQFDVWFKELNPDINSETYVMFENKRTLVENEFQDNNEAFKYLNIKYLQHSQIGALALIYDHLENSLKNKENLFIKIGTGQGKSLIIAETVRKIIQINRKSNRIKQKIFVITCYDHLAKIDFQNYQNYYRHFDIHSIYCSSDSSTKDFVDGDVIYADLKTYFNVLRKDGFIALIKSGRIDLPDLSNAILIMDEFDSLILDSDHIFQVAYRFKLENYNENICLDHKEDIRKLFDGIFSNEMKEKFGTIIDRWCDKLLHEKQEEDKRNDNRKFQDTLGKEHTFVQSLLNELLNESTASFIHFYLHPLVFYCKFKQVIGFSGSITANGIHRLKTLFENKTCRYYEIPPFFGLINLENNRKFMNKPGIIKKDTFEYLNAIQDEIKRRHVEQPLLIFADSFKKSDQIKSDYEYIYEKLLEAKETFLKDSTIIKIVDETDIQKNIHDIGRLGSITLATRIIARGADIKVHKNVDKGLHLILTYYPERENIYIQMLGRTARQDEKGSYSEITRSSKNFLDITTIKIDPKKKICHNVTEYFYKNIPSNLKDTKNLAIKWNLFSCLMQQMSDTEINQNELIEFVDRHIFHSFEL